MAEARYDQDVRRDKDLLPYVYANLPEREFGDVQFDGELVFGIGEDGDVTISADTSLSEDMYYNNLTVDAGKTLNPNGWRVFVKNTLTLNGDLGIKESVTSVSAGSLSGTVAVGQSVVDGLGGAGEPDGYEPGFTFTGSGSVTSSLGVTTSDFYDLRAAINAYQRRGGDFLRAKGGAGGGTGADGVGGAGAAGSWPPNANTVGAPGGKGSAGSGGAGGGGGRGGGVVMLAARVIAGAGGIYSEGGGSVAGAPGSGGTPAPTYTDPASTSHHEGSPVTGFFADTGGSHHAEGSPVEGSPVEGSPVEGSPVEGSPVEGAPVTVEGAPVEGPDVEGPPVEGPDVEGPPAEGAPVEGAPVEGPDGAAHHHEPAGPTHHNSTYNFHLPGDTQVPVFHGFEGPDVEGPPAEGSPVEGAPVEGPPAEGGPSEGSPVEGSPVTGEGAPVEGSPVEGSPVEGSPVEGGNVEGPDVFVDYFEEGEAFSYEGPDVQAHEAATDHPGGAGGGGGTGQRGGKGGGGVLIVVTRNAGTPTYTFNTGVNGQVIALDTANI